MHVDGARAPSEPVDDRAVDQLVPSGPLAGPHHDLGRVLRSGQIDQCGGDVVAEHPAVLAAELLQQPATLRHLLDPTVAIGVEAGVGDDVHTDQLALGALGDARRATHEALGPRRRREGDHDPFAGLPRLRDVVAVAVRSQYVVDLAGDPQQRQLAQRREVPGAEVVPQRGVDLVRRVDVAVGHPAPQSASMSTSSIWSAPRTT